MMNWYEVARDARNAANELVEARFRSCVSRAYYAVYSKVTHELSALPHIAFPQGQEGPNHPGKSGKSGIYGLVESSMPGMSQTQREALADLIGTLYKLRVYADYRPSMIVDDREAREAISMMKTAFEAF